MHYCCFVLKPRGPLRIGKRGIGVEEAEELPIPSDTLYGAVITAYSELYGYDEAIELCQHFVERKPPFVLSSVLPKVKGDFLLPMPVGILSLIIEPPSTMKEVKMEVNLHKHLKRAKFCTLKALKELIAKRRSLKEFYEMKEEFEVVSGILLMHDELKRLFPSDESLPMYELESRVRNVVDRITQAAEIYYESNLVILDPVELYVLALIEDSFVNELTSCFKLLVEQGIGGERSIGRGLFNFLGMQDWPSLREEEGDAILTLGLTLPCSEDRSFLIKKLEEGFPISYRIIQRGGWGGSSGISIIRRSVFAFSEGSLLPIPQRDTGWFGSTFKERSSPPLYRIYMSCYMKINLPR